MKYASVFFAGCFAYMALLLSKTLDNGIILGTAFAGLAAVLWRFTDD
jgi:hypothetical protein